MSTITHITSSSQLSTILSTSAKGKLVVIDFHATWCGPCHAIAPRYEALSKEYTNVVFLKCDVDACQDVSGEYRISAMPTFVFLKNGTKVDEVRGANPSGIVNALRKHAGAGSGASGAAFAGKGHTLGGSATGSTQPDAISSISTGFDNLDPQVKIMGLLVVGYLVFWYFFT